MVEVSYMTTKNDYHRYGEELRQSEKMKSGYTYSSFEMRPDFPRPEFYKELFRMWGLDVG